MATPTYDLLDSTTLSSNASSVTFTSIDQSYRDLIIVFAGGPTSSISSQQLTFNGDGMFASGYSSVYALGGGSSASSNSKADSTEFTLQMHNSLINMSIVQIMDYSQTDKHKTCLIRNDSPNKSFSEMRAFRYARTTAISSVTFYEETFDWRSGSTFHLYGITA